MRRVFVASPYAGDIDRNVHYATCAMADCLRRGEAPFAPHLLYTRPGVLRDEDPKERALGMAAGNAWAEIADALVVYTDLGVSAGMEAEIAEARRREQTIEYRSLGGCDW